MTLAPNLSDRPLPVTVIIPTRNEEKRIASCLEALVGFYRVVVLDSFSTDYTRSISERAGAEVIDFRWQGGFPKERNWMLLNYKFETPWVLFVDADEHVNRRFIEELANKIP